MKSSNLSDKESLTREVGALVGYTIMPSNAGMQRAFKEAIRYQRIDLVEKFLGNKSIGGNQVLLGVCLCLALNESSEMIVNAILETVCKRDFRGVCCDAIKQELQKENHHVVYHVMKKVWRNIHNVPRYLKVDQGWRNIHKAMLISLRERVASQYLIHRMSLAPEVVNKILQYVGHSVVFMRDGRICVKQAGGLSSGASIRGRTIKAHMLRGHGAGRLVSRKYSHHTLGQSFGLMQ